MPVQQIPTEMHELCFDIFYPGVTPQQVFAWWTTPKLLRQWWTGTNGDAEIQPHSGGSYQLTWKPLNITLRGIYTVFKPGEELVFSWHWDHEPERPERMFRVNFAAENGGTRLNLTHETYTEQDDSERQEHLDGWMYFLDVLYQQLVTPEAQPTVESKPGSTQ